MYPEKQKATFSLNFHREASGLIYRPTHLVQLWCSQVAAGHWATCHRWPDKMAVKLSPLPLLEAIVCRICQRRRLWMIASTIKSFLQCYNGRCDPMVSTGARMCNDAQTKLKVSTCVRNPDSVGWACPQIIFQDKTGRTGNQFAFLNRLYLGRRWPFEIIGGRRWEGGVFIKERATSGQNNDQANLPRRYQPLWRARRYNCMSSDVRPIEGYYRARFVTGRIKRRRNQKTKWGRDSRCQGRTRLLLQATSAWVQLSPLRQKLLFPKWTT